MLQKNQQKQGCCPRHCVAIFVFHLLLLCYGKRNVQGFKGTDTEFSSNNAIIYYWDSHLFTDRDVLLQWEGFTLYKNKPLGFSMMGSSLGPLSTSYDRTNGKIDGK